MWAPPVYDKVNPEDDIEKRREKILQAARSCLKFTGMLRNTDFTEHVPHVLLAWCIASGVWYVPECNLDAFEETYKLKR